VRDENEKSPLAELWLLFPGIYPGNFNSWWPPILAFLLAFLICRGCNPHGTNKVITVQVRDDADVKWYNNKALCSLTITRWYSMRKGQRKASNVHSRGAGR
jgi:hypothetical protein